MLNEIFLSFIPIFVAVDAIGVLPIFITLTESIDEKQKNRIIVQAMLTAAGLSLSFILIGKAVFHILGITVPDFMIAGGIILFCIAIIDMLSSAKERRKPDELLGVVPLGIPLIVGPAVLTTTIIIVSKHGIMPSVISVLINIILAGLVFKMSNQLNKILGAPLIRAFSKIMSLLLAAIAIMLIRTGLEKILIN